MESSESSFSDVSSCTSASSVIQDVPVAPSAMSLSFAVQRSDSEMKMIDEAVSSLMNTLERYSLHLTDTQYAFYCRYSTDFLNGEMNRKARKAKKNGMDNTMMKMGDASIYPSNAPHNLRYARAPSTVSSVVTDDRQRPVSERNTPSGLSSGYSSGMPSIDCINSNSAGALNPRKNGTLLQVIEEAQESEELGQRLHGRPELPIPTSSSADDDPIDEEANEDRVSGAIPKPIKLFNWSLTLTGEELCVAGYSTNKSKITPGPVKKYSHPVVVASKGSFLVMGNPCFEETTPGFVKTACKNGFPRTWRSLARKWIADRQARRKSNPKNTPERKNKHYTASGKKKKPDVSASKATPKSASKEKPSKKNVEKNSQNPDESIVSPVAAMKTKAKVKSRSNPDVSLKKKKKRDTPEDERDGRPKKPVDIFGDDPDTGVTDAFSALGGEHLLSFPCSRSMTPNTLVASIPPDAGTIGRYTPPLQNVLNLFAANSRKTNSTLGSPSSLNNSRDNPVSKRVAKVVEATKKGGKKKKLPELRAPDELTDLVESLKSTNAQKTPNIVKKIFRNQRENEDDESDLDESMVY